MYINTFPRACALGYAGVSPLQGSSRFSPPPPPLPKNQLLCCFDVLALAFSLIKCFIIWVRWFVDYV